MEQKRDKTTKTILIFLLSAGLILNLMFWLGSVSAKFKELINSNPITLKLMQIYIFASLLCALISFINAVHAVMGLREIYKLRTSMPKRFCGYWIYLIVSLTAFVLHCIVFVIIFFSITVNY